MFMGLQFENILLQILMVLFPIILYQALQSNQKFGKKEAFYWGMVFTTTMGLCLAYGFEIKEGIYLDLRMVPWFLAFIYGGKVVGTFVTAFYAVVRFITGGDGMVPAYIVLLLGTMVIWEFRSHYIKWERKVKIIRSTLLIMFLSALIPFLGTFLLHEQLTWRSFLIHIGFVVANVLSVWLAVHLMETHMEKQALIKEIQKSEKLQVVGQVAASVAHEIRNPMTSVRGFIQILSGSTSINATEKNYLNICLDELDRANEIISDYLCLGKNNELEQHAPIDLSKLANRSVNTLFSFATLHNVHLSLEMNKPAFVMGNSSRLQQMLVNLIKNAIEAAGTGGNVKVTVSVVEQQAVITVQDDGVGMTPQQVENIGIPYYSTKEKGTGLGLMVSLQIINEMNGSWKVTSVLNKETTFQISFPLTEQKSIIH
jgi:two-component system, sporulation sensor kinase B